MQARGVAPAIIFIDEIDAVGRIRGGAQGNDERDQTLNQMLSEMDGFGDGVGVIVMAATNRVDVLDPALIRPGRFDRIIQVALPDVMGRVETFWVCQKMVFGPLCSESGPAGLTTLPNMALPNARGTTQTLQGTKQCYIRCAASRVSGVLYACSIHLIKWLHKCLL